jgi:hypothetical protein
MIIQEKGSIWGSIRLFKKEYYAHKFDLEVG